MTDVTLWWRGYGSADVNTDYVIQSDEAVSHTFATVTTRDATSPYVPHTTTLTTALTTTDTALTLDNATNFSNGNRVKINGETIILAGKSGATFSGITRGADNTVPIAHAAGSIVSRMHETYPVTGVDFGLRHVVRFRVAALVGSTQLVAAEATAVKPSLPPTNDFTVIWGLIDQLWSVPPSGVVTLSAISDTDNFNPRTAETYFLSTQTATTDADGYWELIVPRAVARVGGDVLQLNVGGKTFPLRPVPDVDTICYLELI